MLFCPICKKHETDSDDFILYHDDYFYIVPYVTDRDGTSNYLGYYFLEASRHFDGIQNAKEEELNAMILMTKYLGEALIHIFGGERIYTFITGDGVKHLHEHVVLKHTGTPSEYKGVRVDEWPEAPRGSYRDVIDLNHKIKEYWYEKGIIQKLNSRNSNNYCISNL